MPSAIYGCPPPLLPLPPWLLSLSLRLLTKLPSLFTFFTAAAATLPPPLITTTAARYDLLCMEGVVRGLLVFLGKLDTPRYTLVEPAGGAARQRMTIKPSVCPLYYNL